MLLVIACGLIAYLFQQQSQRQAAAAATQTSVAVVRTATAQIVETQQAIKTRQAIATQSASATQAAKVYADLLREAALWPVRYEEDFSADRGHWYLGADEDDLTKGKWSMPDGHYLIEIEAVDGFSQWMWPESDDQDLVGSGLTDFSASVEMAFSSVPSDAEVGLIFQLQTADSSFYLYDLRADGTVIVYLRNAGEWETLLEAGTAASFQPEAPNKLEVIGKAGTYYLFLNGEKVGEFYDERLDHGWAGILVGLSNAGDQGTWIADNFVLKEK